MTVEAPSLFDLLDQAVAPAAVETPPTPPEPAPAAEPAPPAPTVAPAAERPAPKLAGRSRCCGHPMELLSGWTWRCTNPDRRVDQAGGRCWATWTWDPDGAHLQRPRR